MSDTREVEIYFDDLTAEKQKELLTAYSIKSPLEMNWDVLPIFTEVCYPQKTEEPVIRVFMDLDGVLAAWDPDADEDTLYNEGFFLERPLIQGYKNILLGLRSEGFSVWLLSAYLADSEYALWEKETWCRRNLPEIHPSKCLFTPTFSSKADMPPGGIRPTDVLIDDHSPNLRAWGGIGIKAKNPYNCKRGTWTGLRISETDDPKEVARLIREAVASV